MRRARGPQRCAKTVRLPRRSRSGSSRSSIRIDARAGREGRLFGSVTAADIVEAVEPSGRGRRSTAGALVIARADQGGRVLTRSASASTPKSSSRSTSRSSQLTGAPPAGDHSRVQAVTGCDSSIRRHSCRAPARGIRRCVADS